MKKHKKCRQETTYLVMIFGNQIATKSRRNCNYNLIVTGEVVIDSRMDVIRNVGTAVVPNIPRETPSAGTLNTWGWDKFAIFDRCRSLSRKRYEIGPWLLWVTNRKPYRFQWPSVTSKGGTRGVIFFRNFAHTFWPRTSIFGKIHVRGGIFLGVNHASIQRGRAPVSQNCDTSADARSVCGCEPTCFFVRYTLLHEKETVLRFLKQPIFKIVLQKSFSIIV